MPPKASKSGAKQPAKRTAKAAKAGAASKATGLTPSGSKGAAGGGGERAAGISDEAVRKATGMGWDEWFAILDRFDVAGKGHKAAAIHVHEEHACPEWWSQMVVVQYEQARGLREKHQTARGYQVGASKTIAAPVERAFDAFADAKQRKAWLPGVELAIRKATRPKSLRITFVSGAGLAGSKERPSNLDVNLYAKGDDKCQLQVQHDKLATSADGERMKEFWRDALDRLKARLEG